MFLSGPRSPLHKIMFPSQNRRNRRKDYPKKMMRNLSLAFFISSRGILLRTQEHVAHVGGICCGQTGLKHETNHHLHFYCCPNQATKKDVDKWKNTTWLMTGTAMMRTPHMSCRTLPWTKTEISPWQRAWLSTYNRVWNIYFRINKSNIWRGLSEFSSLLKHIECIISVVTNHNMYGCGSNILSISSDMYLVFSCYTFACSHIMTKHKQKKSQYILFLFFPSLSGKSLNSMLILYHS